MQRLTIGKQLRKITEDAKATNAEAQALFDAMKARALMGESSLRFDDLRTIAPNMIQRETLFSWFDAEEIRYNGLINPETAAWEYTLSW